MSLLLIKAAAMTTLGTVTGIPSAANLGYWPRSIQTSRTLSTIHIRSDRQITPAFIDMTYELRSIVWIAKQDEGVMETELDGLINAIPYVVDLDNTLGGTCNLARITAVNSLFRTIGNTVYRCGDFTWFIKEKKPRNSGI